MTWARNTTRVEHPNIDHLKQAINATPGICQLVFDFRHGINQQASFPVTSFSNINVAELFDLLSRLYVQIPNKFGGKMGEEIDVFG
jgi:hypothetical protein